MSGFIKDFQDLSDFNGYALTTSVIVLTVTVGVKRISRKIPGALFAVVGAIIISWTFNLDKYLTMLGEVPTGLPHIGLPLTAWYWDIIIKLMPTAFAMFVVILAQSAATSRAYAARYNERFSENVDLVGLGLANIGAAIGRLTC